MKPILTTVSGLNPVRGKCLCTEHLHRYIPKSCRLYVFIYLWEMYPLKTLSSTWQHKYVNFLLQGHEIRVLSGEYGENSKLCL